MTSRRDRREGVLLEWSASQARVAFSGTEARLDLRNLGDSRWSDCRENVLELVVDGKDTIDHVVNAQEPWVAIGPLEPGRHVVKVSKRTEALCGRVALGDVAVKGGVLQHPGGGRDRRILFIGGAVTCGYGVMDNDPRNPFRPGTQSGTSSFAAEAAHRLGAEFASVCVSGHGLLRNSDGRTEDLLPSVVRKGSLQESGELAAAPDVVVLEIGQSEVQTSHFDPRSYTRAYVDFVMEIHQRWPQAWIVGVDTPALDEEGLEALRGVLVPVDQWVRGRLKVKSFSRLFLTQQGDVGYGGAGFPNRLQSMMNGNELAVHLREHLGWRLAANTTR